MAPSSLSTHTCAATAFGTLTLAGAEILSVQASLVQNYSSYVPDYLNFNHPTIVVSNAEFCNVTVTYTHVGKNDDLTVEAWLPTNDWNGRLQAVGGSGWVAGRYFLTYYGMAGAIGEGYATITTDAGLGSATDPTIWGLSSTGEVDTNALANFASVSLNDEAVLGKELVQSFYGRKPDYSYWSGCSQGGRQGMALAQEYPDAYDGIVASAPAINTPEFAFADFWPELIMNLAQEYPYPCELDAIRSAAINECDANDGVEDGLISNMDACHFDPSSVIGTVFNCSNTGGTMKISASAALVASKAWSGAYTLDGKQIWPGPNIGSDLTGDSSIDGAGGIAETSCSNGSCTPVPFTLVTQWIQVFLEKNLTFDYTKITRKQLDALAKFSASEYDSIIGTNNPDLSAFKKRGGKLLSYHGLIDGIIPTKGTEKYYNSVKSLDPKVHDFYRLFEIPGIEHCMGGEGGLPTGIFDAMRAWVENGTVPESLSVSFDDASGVQNNRIVCPYPKKASYDATCGDSTAEECFYCA